MVILKSSFSIDMGMNKVRMAAIENDAIQSTITGGEGYHRIWLTTNVSLRRVKKVEREISIKLRGTENVIYFKNRFF